LKTFWHYALVHQALCAIVLIVSYALQTSLCLLLWWAQGQGSTLVQALVAGVAVLLLAALLKPLLAWRMLRDEVLAVEAALQRSLPEGRAQLARLVSRDVQHLSAAQVREAAIESLAENLSDSVVAPLCWFALLGLPGAALYRFANTADAMWGYPGMRGGHYWQWAGKWAARVDDVLNWVPARITALLLWLVAGRFPRPWGARAGWAAWAAFVQQARSTPSPNGGWPMATMALLLGVCLAKPGVYALNPHAPAPQAVHIHQAVFLGQKVVATAVLASLFALFLIAMNVNAIGAWRAGW
jgi:adenosylcobinamide-phosphate synthase